MSIILDALTLPDELVWIDKYDWGPVNSTASRTISEKLIVTESVVTAQQGRPITLSGEFAWLKRLDLDTLWDMTLYPDTTMTLTLHDASVYSVRFRHWEKPVLTAPQLIDTAFPDDDTYHTLILKLAMV